MDEGTLEFQRLLFLIPEAFPPLSALVQADIGASARRRGAASAGSDHYLVLKLGRNQETLLTSLPPEAIPKRFDESAYGMVVADGMGSLADVASGLSVAGLLQLALRFGRWNLRVDDQLARTSSSGLRTLPPDQQRARQCQPAGRRSSPA